MIISEYRWVGNSRFRLSAGVSGFQARADVWGDPETRQWESEGGGSGGKDWIRTPEREQPYQMLGQAMRRGGTAFTGRQKEKGRGDGLSATSNPPLRKTLRMRTWMLFLPKNES